MAKEAETQIRLMRAEERKTVREIMKLSFPFVQQWFFSFTPHVLVADRNGRLLGAIILKIITLPGKRKGGLLYWAFTSPEVRGEGIGQQLFEAGIRYLEDKGCQEIMGCIEGNNTSSSNLLSKRGFHILSPGQQFRRYGLRMLLVWLNIFHYLDIGHFLWVRPGPDRADNTALQWWGNLAMNSLLLLIVLWRIMGGKIFEPAIFFKVPLMLCIFFGGRELAMRIAAQKLGFPIRYHAWESAFPLGAVLALLFAWWFPILGSVYPVTPNWRYRDNIRKLGLTAAAGGLAVLIISWGVWILQRSIILPPVLLQYAELGKLIGSLMPFFDIFLPFFPFVSFNGRRIWDWNRLVWCVMAAIALARLFV